MRSKLRTVECFLVDQMLLRLGRWLRLLGLDVANPADVEDDLLLQTARKESRTLITRDKGLFAACEVAGVKCIFIRSSQLEEQLREMAQRGIDLELNPQRCTLCNSPLQKVTSPERAMWRCSGCQKLYWEGAHWRKMTQMLDVIRSQKG